MHRNGYDNGANPHVWFPVRCQRPPAQSANAAGAAGGGGQAHADEVGRVGVVKLFRVRVLKKSGNIFRVGIFLDFICMGRTCGEPNEIELTAIGVKLNGTLSGTTQAQSVDVGHGNACVCELLCAQCGF